MGEFFAQIPENIQGHIRDITKSSGLDESEESVEKMAEAWLEKKGIFETKIKVLGMEELSHLDMDDEKGVIALTYSGSLINVGPLVDGRRTVMYMSIGIRGDVPDSVKGSNGKLARDINIDEEIEFASGPIKSTSAIYKIAACKGNLIAYEQEKTLTKATQIITEEFTAVNKTILL